MNFVNAKFAPILALVFQTTLTPQKQEMTVFVKIVQAFVSLTPNAFNARPPINSTAKDKTSLSYKLLAILIARPVSVSNKISVCNVPIHNS